MKSVGIFFGSSTGMTEGVATRIAERLGVDSAHVHNVSETSAQEVAAYDVLLLGTSTWGCGDLQDDWESFLDDLKGQDLSGKYVGLFGCGDSASYGDTFCGALGIIYDALQGSGCSFVGAVPAENYTFDDSEAVRDGQFVGLALDEMNEDDLTDERIESWVSLLQAEALA